METEQRRQKLDPRRRWIEARERRGGWSLGSEQRRSDLVPGR